MLKQIVIGAATAVTIAGASLVAGTPAQAAQVGIYVNPGYAPDNSGCWRWSPRYHHWRWVCAYDQPEYYQQPYSYGPSPFFGFGFSFGDHGDRGDRHFDRGGDRDHRWDRNH